jgi:NADH-quinone oxidoreductase subunit J
VVVYIGAISILIIFAIMLTRRVMQDTGPQTHHHLRLPALLVAGLVGFGIWYALRDVRFSLAAGPLPNSETVLVTLGDALANPNFYMVPLVAVGVLLAAGMIGSIAIARDEDKE